MVKLARYNTHSMDTNDQAPDAGAWLMWIYYYTLWLIHLMCRILLQSLQAASADQDIELMAARHQSECTFASSPPSVYSKVRSMRIKPRTISLLHMQVQWTACQFAILRLADDASRAYDAVLQLQQKLPGRRPPVSAQKKCEV